MVNLFPHLVDVGSDGDNALLLPGNRKLVLDDRERRNVDPDARILLLKHLQVASVRPLDKGMVDLGDKDLLEGLQPIRSQ